MLIITKIVTPFEQNARVLMDEDTQTCTIVDPGGDIPDLVAEIDLTRYQVKTILITHAHIDHVGGLNDLVSILKNKGHSPTVLAHRKEQQFRETMGLQATMFGVPYTSGPIPEPDQYIEDGDQIKIGGCDAKILFTPGHSPGHISVFIPSTAYTLKGDYSQPNDNQNGPILIAGDTLFSGSIGRTDLIGGDHNTLINSIQTKLLSLPKETLVLSGHGPNTTIGTEIQHNPFL